jgi:hypothetical protein
MAGNAFRRLESVDTCPVLYETSRHIRDGG